MYKDINECLKSFEIIVSLYNDESIYIYIIICLLFIEFTEYIESMQLGEKLIEIVEKSFNEGNKDKTNIIIDGLLIKVLEILSENKSNSQLTLFLLHLLNILSNSIFLNLFI